MADSSSEGLVSYWGSRTFMVEVTTGLPCLKDGLLWLVRVVGGGTWRMGMSGVMVVLFPASLSVYEGGRAEISGASS